VSYPRVTQSRLAATSFYIHNDVALASGISNKIFNNMKNVVQVKKSFKLRHFTLGRKNEIILFKERCITHAEWLYKEKPPNVGQSTRDECEGLKDLGGICEKI
jgi:hypothetical protein